MEDSVVIPQRSGTGNTICPSNTLLAIYPKEYKSFYYEDTCTHMFIAAKTWYQPKRPPMIDWVKKMWYIYTMQYYAAIRKE